jgi:hypothetical protein
MPLMTVAWKLSAVSFLLPPCYCGGYIGMSENQHEVTRYNCLVMNRFGTRVQRLLPELTDCSRGMIFLYLAMFNNIIKLF